MTLQGALVEFQPGTTIFTQGDPGGDLFFIKEGEVEVFRAGHGGTEVKLARMKTGEVLGIMTCLTREPRLASARAATHVKALIVKQAGIKTLISTTPQWVHTVIKDFIVRVKQMDELYAAAVERIAEKEREASTVRLAAQLAVGLADVGAMLTSAADASRVVDVDVAMGHVAKILDAPREKLEAIFATFLEVGLLRADPGAQVKRAELAVLERLGVYAEFARTYLSSPGRRQTLDALTPRDLQVLLGVCELAKTQKLKLTQEVKLPEAKVQVEGVPVEAAVATLRKAHDALLLKRVETGAVTDIVFTPASLSAAVRSLLAVHKLQAPDRQPVAELVPQGAAQIITENF